MTPFDFVAARLEAGSPLARLEARGTLRIALRAAGLEADASARELAVVLRRTLPTELAARGVAAPEALCEELAGAVSSQPFEADGARERPEDVFRRLGGRDGIPPS